MTRKDLKDLINIIEAVVERIDAGEHVSLTITNGDGKYDYKPRVEYKDSAIFGLDTRKMVWMPGRAQGCAAEEMLEAAQDWQG
jgi:hypothetical protein